MLSACTLPQEGLRKTQSCPQLGISACAVTHEQDTQHDPKAAGSGGVQLGAAQSRHPHQLLTQASHRLQLIPGGGWRRLWQKCPNCATSCHLLSECLGSDMPAQPADPGIADTHRSYRAGFLCSSAMIFRIVGWLTVCWKSSSWCQSMINCTQCCCFAGCLALAGQQAMGAGLLLWPYGLCFRKTPSSSPEPLVLLRHFPPRMGTLTMNMSQPGHIYMLPAATVSQCTTMQHGSWRLINI